MTSTTSQRVNAQSGDLSQTERDYLPTIPEWFDSLEAQGHDLSQLTFNVYAPGETVPSVEKRKNSAVPQS
jgi:hypothetical protein